ncbi:MAG: thiamine diphosphokinase [Clostridia bacterium]|nr:thiamine diphosphokinase [Clostridia bacterium]
MGICYIVGAGEFYGSLSPTDDDFVIAADGGLDTLHALGIRCDLLVGDMDSISAPNYSGEIVKHPVEKDETDMHLSYLEGVKRGYSKFVLYGGVGGREDHTFANYSLLLYAKLHGHDMKLISKRDEIFVIKDEKIEISGSGGEPFSLFAFGSVATGVTIRGAKYEAKGVSLTPDFPLGVSNELKDTRVTLSVECGSLLVMHSKFAPLK